jgi:hypothetical protein
MIQLFRFSYCGFYHVYIHTNTYMYILQLFPLFRDAQVFQRLMRPIVTPATLRVPPVRELQERVQRRSLDIEYASAKGGTMVKVDILPGACRYWDQNERRRGKEGRRERSEQNTLPSRLSPGCCLVRSMRSNISSVSLIAEL